jgi:hypothetical protein
MVWSPRAVSVSQVCVCAAQASPAARRLLSLFLSSLSSPRDTPARAASRRAAVAPFGRPRSATCLGQSHSCRPLLFSCPSSALLCPPSLAPASHGPDRQLLPRGCLLCCLLCCLLQQIDVSLTHSTGGSSVKLTLAPPSVCPQGGSMWLVSCKLQSVVVQVSGARDAWVVYEVPGQIGADSQRVRSKQCS